MMDSFQCDHCVAGFACFCQTRRGTLRHARLVEMSQAVAIENIFFARKPQMWGGVGYDNISLKVILVLLNKSRT